MQSVSVSELPSVPAPVTAELGEKLYRYSVLSQLATTTRP